MMLRTFRPSMQQRYALAGAAVGAILPLFCFSVESGMAGTGLDWAMPFRDASHFFMTLMPLFCGLVFYRIASIRSILATELESSMEAEKRLFHEARHDRLTGLGNRLALEHEIRFFLKARQQRALSPAVLLLDVDKFKYINDTLGHDVGDALLVAIAARLKANLGPHSRLFRLGGDEFVITMAGVPDESEIGRLCDIVKQQLAQPFDLKGSRVVTGVSIGATIIDHADTAIGQILKRADLALYRAKLAAGSHHVFFTPELGEIASARRKLERDLAHAVGNGELFLEYQPIVSAETRQVRGFEALLRWNHPDLGILAPADFIAEAERNGLILTIGKWVLETACRQAARWPGQTSVAVNVSADQFKDRSFAVFVKKVLEESGLSPARLTLEITETLFSVDAGILSASLESLRALGVRFALDDFGSGFSSIAHLRTFPVDYIKIDRSLAGAMLDNNRDGELVDLIVRLSGAFNAVTTVEGIETDAQLDFVNGLGAGEVQGYLVSRPVAAGAVETFIANAGAQPQPGAFKIGA